MKKLMTLLALSTCLVAPVWAQQTTPDPSVKTGDGKTDQAKQQPKQSSQPDCSDMQGGTEASGGENVEAHAKADKTKAKTACGKANGKASSPHAAPTTPNPDVKR